MLSHKQTTLRKSRLRPSDRTPPLNLPSSHHLNRLFEPYSKADAYIRPLSRLYDSAMCNSPKYDSVLHLKHQFLQEAPRSSGSLKTSFLPQSTLSSNLMQKVRLINAFNALGSEAKPGRRLYGRPQSKYVAKRKTLPTLRNPEKNSDLSREVAGGQKLPRTASPTQRKVPRRELVEEQPVVGVACSLTPKAYYCMRPMRLL